MKYFYHYLTLAAFIITIIGLIRGMFAESLMAFMVYLIAGIGMIRQEIKTAPIIRD
jgi:dolichyl-phosphate-mannose--protein O-mannosyl transferase